MIGGGGSGCFLHVGLILLGAQDMFRQSPAASAKMSNIPIHPLKNDAQNDDLKNFYHVLVILTCFYVFSHVIL